MADLFFDDAIGEIGNIMMGAGATNLAGLLGEQVAITTPRIDVGLPNEGWPTGRAVVVSIQMSGAVVGRSLFVLPAEEVEAIVRLMMAGMDVAEDELLGELGLSAIGEAMNQLIAGAARALGEILGGLVDITPPDLELVDGASWRPDFQPESVCTVTFDVHIGTETTGQLSWLMDRALAHDLITRIEAGMAGSPTPAAAPAPAPPPAPAPAPAPAAQAAAAGTMTMTHPPAHAAPPPQVAAATYAELGPAGVPVSQAELAMISDVSLTITVELGRTRITVRDLLGLGQGSVVELDRAAGAPVDILVNGTLVARGDVVVVDDELGVRVNEVVDPRERVTA